ncbi:uncharacterized protein BX664DRAFT_352999 [Halteromyces radiatus]|uniref:uncharacterized protein n=1 Tax=Halteromyces radiatus TaxID=101107 RepID=UPI00221E73FF|nr:uncharacterized protein BX664DRAFT_352999 [Halteromyces radiatus]KAI8079844.1 hypothetical protein BX664DRAFT_352999 [Halteromyces radiatus]
MTGFLYRWHSLHDPSKWLLPTMYDKDDNKDLVLKRQQIDEKYCGGPCRFILPLFIMEQESKAQMHFRQLAFMSGLVNRTVVLPNVGGSRLGACLENDFEFYYSRSWAINNQEHFQHITMSDFKQWLLERHAIDRPATSQSMHIHVNLRGHAVEPENCFASQQLLNMNGLPERRLYLNETANPLRRLYYEDAVKDFFLGIYRDSDTGESVQDEITDKIEVLGVYYDRRFPFIHNPAAETPIPYSEQVISEADKIANTLSPYWAVHWRTERVEPASNLVECAHTLVDYFNTRAPLMSSLNNSSAESTTDNQQPTLFLLTDYPHVFDEQDVDDAIANNGTNPKMRPASASFSPHSLTIHHHLAMQYVYQHLQVHVTHLDEQNGSSSSSSPANWTVLPIGYDIARQDPGWLGILDKLLAMRADGFLAGAPGVCGRKSSFTNQIMNERLDHPRTNVIDYFDLPNSSQQQQ